MVCRWGGEEFIIMLLNRDCTEAKDLAEQFRKEIENIVINWQGDELKVTMTFGVTEYDYNDSMETCILKADQALYIGKKNGRNWVVG